MNVRTCAVLALSVLSVPENDQLARAGEPVDVRRTANQIEVLIAGRPFTSYHFDPAVAKPYLSPLRSAYGTVFTREYPMIEIEGEDYDEPHQRAMYFAHGDINGFDFWGEAAFPRWSRHPMSRYGRTVFRKLDDMRSGPDRGTVRAEFDLVGRDDAIAEEVQSYSFRGDGSARIVDCEFAVHAVHGPVIMGDTKEGTFAIRLVKALASPQGHMLSSNGAAGEKAIWGKRARWVDYYGTVAGEEVGIAIFDHPQNLRSPTFWHARAYGLLAANPFGLKSFISDSHQDGTYRIPPDGTLVLRYRVFIHHGTPEQASVSEAYRQFAEGSS